MEEVKKVKEETRRKEGEDSIVKKREREEKRKTHKIKDREKEGKGGEERKQG